MVYSYSKISQYVSCPRAYRHRYVEGWKEKHPSADLVFGRTFERALAAYFRREDSGQRFHDEWAKFRDVKLAYERADTWDRMFTQGIQLLERFCQEDRVRIADPNSQMQVRVSKPISPTSEFVGWIDAVGELDRIKSIIEWKTTSTPYSRETTQLLALDPQLICYSWLTRIEQVATVVFVRKRSSEIQYVRATTTHDQRQHYGELVQETIKQIESARFLPHTGIRFPNYSCTSCPFIGVCLENQDLITSKLVEGRGDDVDWID